MRKHSEETKQKISLALKGKLKPGHGFQKGYDKRRHFFSVEDRKKATLKILEKRPSHSRGRILEEQNYKCIWCNLGEWLGKPITLELDHIDGNKRNNNRNNLRLLCPNCHSQTPTWRRKK